MLLIAIPFSPRCLNLFSGQRITIDAFLCIAQEYDCSPFVKNHIIRKLILQNCLRSHLISLDNSAVMIVLFSSSIFNSWQQCSLRLQIHYSEDMTSLCWRHLLYYPDRVLYFRCYSSSSCRWSSESLREFFLEKMIL